MIAYDRTGAGPPILLLHGTNGDRHMWDGILPALATEREVIAIDTPGHGGSAPTSYVPPGFAQDIAAFLDELGISRIAAVGNSSGAWTALELAKLGRASGVLALAPAGFWRHRAPRLTSLTLQVGWHLGRRTTALSERLLHTRAGRVIALSSVSANPGAVPPEVALALTRGIAKADNFPEHFRQIRALRFLDGDRIPDDVPVRVVWGDKDRIITKRKANFTDELPAHAEIETWTRCGHSVMWDQPELTVAAALKLPTA